MYNLSDYEDNIMQEQDYKLAASRNDHDNLANCINRSYETVEYYYHIGRISQLVWESYCWLWRNSAYHFSSLNKRYEGKPIPDDCYELVYPYLDKVLVTFFK